MARPPDDITFRQLRTFACAARLGSFAQAAEELGVAQPSISEQIIGLEARIGQQLFKRRNGTTPVLTEDGQDAFERVARILEMTDELLPAANTAIPRRATVRICIGPLLRDTILKPILPQILNDHPGIQLEIVPMLPAPDVEMALRERQIDLLVCTALNRRWMFPNAVVYGEVPMVLVVPPEFSKRIRDDWAALADMQFILPGPPRLSDRWAREVFRHLKVTPNRAPHTIEFPETIVDMVAQGNGISVMFEDGLEAARAAGRIETIELDLPKGKRILVAARPTSPAAETIAALLGEALGRMQFPHDPNGHHQ